MNNAECAARAFEVAAARPGAWVGTALVTGMIPAQWLDDSRPAGEMIADEIHLLVKGRIVRLTEGLCRFSEATARQLEGAGRGDIIPFALDHFEALGIDALHDD